MTSDSQFQADVIADLRSLGERVRSLEARLVINQEMDRQLTSSVQDRLAELRSRVEDLEQNGCSKWNPEHRRKTERLDRTNTLLAFVVLALFLLYLRDVIAAGQVFQIIASLLIGTSAAGYSVYEARKEKNR